MNKTSNFPVMRRQDSNPEVAPMIPLNYVYPGMSLAQIFSIVWGYWKVSLIIISVILVLTVVTLKMLPRKYTAEATLMVNYKVSDPQNGKELPDNQLGSYINTQIQLMQNKEVLLEVVEKLNLTENKHYAAGYDGKNGTLEQWVESKLRKDLMVNRGDFGNQLIFIDSSANDPELAAKVANMVVEVYQKQDNQRAISQPAERAARFRTQLVELKKNVEEAQKKVTDFHKEHKLIEKGKRANFGVVMLAGLEDKYLEAQNERRKAEASVSGDRLANDLVLASPEVQDLKKQLAEQKLQLKKLEALYTADHPELQEFKLSIKTTEDSLESALQNYTTNVHEKLKLAKQTEKNLKRAVKKQREKVLANTKLHDEAEKYVLALESAQTVYKNALKAYEQLKFDSRDYFSNISFVSRATPPLKASKPNVLKGLVMGFVAAMMFGLGIPLGYELFNRRVRCRDDLERTLGVSVLAEFGGLSMREAA
jgi:uncharacterized protein involved in exopolysaccharide biosynthesis